MAKTNQKEIGRQKRIKRIRKKVVGTAERPRLRVFKSARHIYAQVIDDSKGHTLVSSSSLNKDVLATEAKDKCARARQVGLKVAEVAKAAGIDKVVFDRGGNLYHGRIKALSEGAREGGLVF